MTINMFRGKYHFLSNFHHSPFTYEGVRYQNAESAFHAQKDPSRAYQFKNLQPNEAKRLGRRVTLRKDWEEVKDAIMYEVVRQKFIENIFQRVSLSGTWPNHYKANLQFTQRNETIAIIPLVPYENQ